MATPETSAPEAPPPRKETSASIRALGKAIADHPNPVRVAFCGFDLWLEVMGSGHTKLRNFKTGGELATGDEDERAVVVPIIVVGDGVVISFDPTLAPDAFRLAP